VIILLVNISHAVKLMLWLLLITNVCRAMQDTLIQLPVFSLRFPSCMHTHTCTHTHKAALEKVLAWTQNRNLLYHKQGVKDCIFTAGSGRGQEIPAN
jgi:hypothetical protein